MTLTKRKNLRAKLTTSERLPDDTTRYWLCCGSTVYPHGEKTCYEAEMGFPQHVRFGTAKDHSDWQKSLSSNKTQAGMKYESMIICPDTDAGYQALHEAIQDGWEPLFHWADDVGNHIVLRKPVNQGD